MLAEFKRGYKVILGPSVHQVEKVMFDRFPLKGQPGGNIERTVSFLLQIPEGDKWFKAGPMRTAVRLMTIGYITHDESGVIFEGEALIMSPYRFFLAYYDWNERKGWLEFHMHTRDMIQGAPPGTFIPDYTAQNLAR